MDIATLLNEHSIDLASYSEVSIESGRAPITLSIWEAEQDTAPTVVFVPGTMTHPLFYSPLTRSAGTATTSSASTRCPMGAVPGSSAGSPWTT